MATSILQSILDRLAGRHEETIQRDLSDVQNLIATLASAEDGKDSDVDPEWAAEVLKREKLTEADVRANVEQYRKRIRLAALHSQADQLREQAMADEKAYNDADLAEGKRHREALKILRDMEDKAFRSAQASSTASSAIGDLMASAPQTAEEAKLNEEILKQNRLNQTHRDAINHNVYPVADASGGPHAIVPANTWAPIDKYPAMLARQTQQQLDVEPSPLSAERRSELQGQLKSAQAAVKQREAQLKAGEARIEELNERLRELGKAKLLPENFRIVRVTPTRDEQRKEYALKMGFGQ